MKKSLGARSIAYPVPVWVIGTYDREGKPNVATAAWVGICASEPPAVCVSFRKERYTYANILDRKAFTVNIPSEDYLKETDYFGLTSGFRHDKTAETGLTPVKGDLVDAPYLKEFPCAIECKLLGHTDVGSHTAFIGEILDVKVDEEMLKEDGTPDVEKLKPLVLIPGSASYYGVGKYLGKAYSVGKYCCSVT